MSEQTLVIIKPDGVERQLIGQIIHEYERNGLVVDQLKLLTASEDLAADHYAEHQGKDFYEDLISYITSGPSVVFTLKGDNAIDRVRKINGATNPADADDNTIRALYGISLDKNTVHASDSPESAQREIDIWFS